MDLHRQHNATVIRGLGGSASVWTADLEEAERSRLLLGSFLDQGLARDYANVATRSKAAMKKDRRNRLRQYGRLDERLAVRREQERLKLPSANLVPKRVVAEREVQRLREGLGL